MSGASRIPGALHIACASPCGNTTTSPAVRCTGSPSSGQAQQEPLVTTWYDIRWSAPGKMFRTMVAPGRRLSDPGFRRLDVEEHRARQTYGSQHIRQRIHRLPPASIRTIGNDARTGGHWSRRAASVHSLHSDHTRILQGAQDMANTIQTAAPDLAGDQGQTAGHLGVGRFRHHRHDAADRRGIAVRGGGPALGVEGPGRRGRQRQLLAGGGPAVVRRDLHRLCAGAARGRPAARRRRAAADHVPGRRRRGAALRGRLVRRRAVVVRRDVRAQPREERQRTTARVPIRRAHRPCELDPPRLHRPAVHRDRPAPAAAGRRDAAAEAGAPRRTWSICSAPAPPTST